MRASLDDLQLQVLDLDLQLMARRIVDYLDDVDNVLVG
jgi:hypothetical protein